MALKLLTAGTVGDKGQIKINIPIKFLPGN